MRRRPALALTAALALTLALAAPAAAWRRPSARERAAIARAAAHAPHAAGKIHVTRIRVSTVGPWASATLAIYFDHQPDYAGAVLHRVGGRWEITAHSPGTFRIQCGIGMPVADQLNLGLGRC